VSELEARFDATRRSVNAPPSLQPVAVPVFARALRPRKSAATRPALVAPERSAGQIVFQTIDLAVLLVESVKQAHSGWEGRYRVRSDLFLSLQALESVCTTTRAVVAPLWQELCVEYLSRPIVLPSNSSHQWRAFFYILAQPLRLSIRGQDNSSVEFVVDPSIQFKKVFDAYIARKMIHGESVRFIFNGDRIRDFDTPLGKDMETGDSLDAMVEMIGD